MSLYIAQTKIYSHIVHMIKNIPTKEIRLTTTKVQLAISNSNSTGSDGLNIRHLKHLDPLTIRYLTECTTLPSTPTQYVILGDMPQSSAFKTKQRPQHWHKLPTHIAFITHCQNTRENTITIHNKKHSNYFLSKWIQR